MKEDTKKKTKKPWVEPKIRKTKLKSQQVLLQCAKDSLLCALPSS